MQCHVLSLWIQGDNPLVTYSMALQSFDNVCQIGFQVALELFVRRCLNFSCFSDPKICTLVQNIFYVTLCAIWANIFHWSRMRVKCDASRHSVFLSWSQSTALWILQLLIADTTLCIIRTKMFMKTFKNQYFFLFRFMNNMDIVQFLLTRHIKLSLNL